MPAIQGVSCIQELPSKFLPSLTEALNMTVKAHILALLIGSNLTSSLEAHDPDLAASAIPTTNIPECIASTILNRNITKWPATGERQASMLIFPTIKSSLLDLLCVGFVLSAHTRYVTVWGNASFIKAPRESAELTCQQGKWVWARLNSLLYQKVQIIKSRLDTLHDYMLADAQCHVIAYIL